MQRRELFSSLFSNKKKENTVIRPPYFDDKDSFYKECPECIDAPCVTFCEENIIVISSDKTPVVSFQSGGCTFCDKCAEYCPNNVLKLEHKKNIDVGIEIDVLKCMSWSQTMCFSCKDPCLDDAIEFLGMFRPSINDSKCTSCGFCISVCPTEAIKIK